MTAFTRCALLISVVAGCGRGEPLLLGLSDLRGQTIEVRARALPYSREVTLFFRLPPPAGGFACPELSPTLSMRGSGRDE